MSTDATLAAPSANGSPDEEQYQGGSVKVLRDAAHIRERPGMYIGDTRATGLHHLAYELVYNSVDEALGGHCSHIQVTVHVDGSLSVADDGRGIPVDIHPEEGRPTLEVVLTKVGAGAKFDNNAYKVSAGLHGMGAKAVTALSDWTTAEVRRNGKTYQQQYERGYAVTEVKELGASTRTGTTITFMPDPTIFADAEFAFATLQDRFRELAFLNRGLSIGLLDERDGQTDSFKFEGGIAAFVEWMNRDGHPEHKPFYIQRTVDAIQIEVALQWTSDDEERVRAYANNAFNVSGGTHLTGFRRGLTRAVTEYGKKNELFKDVEPTGKDIAEGLTAIVSVHLPNPQFEAQTKVRLLNGEVEAPMATAVYETLSKFFEESPKEAKRIIDKIVLAAKAREAAKKAREAIIGRKNLLSGGGLPGKLMDCTIRNREESELFLVEGDSAGGSAEQGRNRHFQAILPLRGKPLNVEKARLEALLDNKEICSIIAALGVDIGNTEDISKLRYGKIVILTDADVDGQHIRTLLLTFFFRQMRKLIEDGHIYVARPPLYRVRPKKGSKKAQRFVKEADEMHRELLARGLDGTRLVLAGETPVTLEGERLAGVVRLIGEIEGPLGTLERRGFNLDTFLTKAGPQGLPAFRAMVLGHEHWFHTAAEVDAFRIAEGTRLGRELVVGEVTPGSALAHQPDVEGAEFFQQELHEVRGVNRGLERLKAFGLGAADFVPTPRVAGREPVVRYTLESGDTRRNLPHLRDLVGEVRRLGERDMEVTRFKGLGEMEYDELWETTLDPAVRTMLRVTMDDATKAHDMFVTLMGEKVEPRRDFIIKHALEVKEIDYHGA